MKIPLSKNFLFLLIISLMLLAGDEMRLINPLKSRLRQPFIDTETRLLNSYQQFLSQVEKVRGVDRQAYLELEGRVRQLAIEQNRLSSCEEENERLKKILNISRLAGRRLLEARVIGIVGGEMKIDQGWRAGVKEKMTVIEDNILVGQVIGLDEFSAAVRLVTDDASKVPVVVKRPGGSSGMVQARGLLLKENGRLVLDRVLQNEDIQKGDLVVTSGEDNWLPEIVIGQIDRLMGTKADVYKRAEVVPLIDYRPLRVVFVVAGEEP